MAWLFALAALVVAVFFALYCRRQAHWIAACVRLGVCPRCGSRQTTRSHEEGPFLWPKTRPTMVCGFCGTSVPLPRGVRREEIDAAMRAATAERARELEEKLERELN